MKPWVLTWTPWVGAPHFAFVTSLAVLPLLVHKPHQGFEHQDPDCNLGLATYHI